MALPLAVLEMRKIALKVEDPYLAATSHHRSAFIGRRLAVTFPKRAVPVKNAFPLKGPEFLAIQG